MKVLFIILTSIFLPITALIAQEYIETENIADANGSVEITNNGKYKIQLTGNYGNHKDYYYFKEIGDVYEKNSIFLKYTAEDDGKVFINMSLEGGEFQTFIFKNVSDNIIHDMEQGTASIIYQNRDFIASLRSSEKNFSPVELKEGESIVLSINTLKKGKLIFDLDVDFEFNDKTKDFASKVKLIDNRKPEDKSYFLVHIRDIDTKDPISASISISDKKRSLLFNGSDVYIGNELNGKVSLKCDAPNYFFQDTLITINPTENQELTVYLRSVSVGKVLKIDKIEFIKGTANLIPGKEAILNRVKDFLVLNSEIRIEIQGHVNNEGKENLKTKSLSKRRALTIKKYFIDSGIDKKRLEHKGFGSDHPIYENPKNEYEQQANRRVEIKIIE